MAKTLDINRSYRDLIDKMNELGLIGFDYHNTVQTKDIFQLAVALGVNTPNYEIKNNDTYVRVESLKIEDKALLSCLLLSQVKNVDDIDNYADLDANYSFAEKCAASGFKILKEYVEEADYDQETLSKYLMMKLNFLYEANVK